MIIRPDGTGGEECIRQHDHAAVSAALADAWTLGGAPGDDVRLAVRLHDVAWLALDHRARLRPDGRPYSFLDHPAEERYRALRTGIDLVESGAAYAGYLCSRHHARFADLADDERARAFAAAERERQARLWEALDAPRRAGAEADLALLQLLDALALFVCCNPPGSVTWPFHRDGFRFGERFLTAAWVGVDGIRLDPMPFDAPVTCRYPAYRCGADGALVEPVDHEVRLGV